MSLRYQAGIVLPGYNALKVANAPTIGTATSASGTSVSVTFTAPACTGGGAISAYTVFANCGVYRTTGASSPLVVTGLTTGTAYTFKAIATNAYGPSYPSAASNSATPVAAGQQEYTTPGTYSWVAPTGVTSVSIVAVGSGGSGGATGNGGGGLGYKNNYTVTPGDSYTVVAGNNANSYFVSTAVVRGGYSGVANTGGTYTGDGGGNGGGVVMGCGGYNGGGGGAGGYSGNGGNGATRCTSSGPQSGSNGSGGGGGGGGNNGSGGGVGLLGQGANGTGGAPNSNGTPGSGGSCANYGGAKSAGGQGFQGQGAVRIIWPGTTRSFPSTNTGNL